MIDGPELQPDLFTGRAAGAATGVRITGTSDRAIVKHQTRLRMDLGRATHFDEIRKLEPLALIVAAERPTGMFTMADVRDEAERIGMLTGEEGRPNAGTGRMEKPRALAYLGALLPGLARIELVEKVTDAAGRTVYQVSDRARANGNKQALWRLTPRGRNVLEAAKSSVASTERRVDRIADVIRVVRETGVHHVV